MGEIVHDSVKRIYLFFLKGFLEPFLKTEQKLKSFHFDFFIDMKSEELGPYANFN